MKAKTTCFGPNRPASGFYLKELNTLRLGEADMRFYITTVQDG